MNIKDALLESITIATENLNLKDFDSYVKDLRETIEKEIDNVEVGDRYSYKSYEFVVCEISIRGVVYYILMITKGITSYCGWDSPSDDINKIFGGQSKDVFLKIPR